MAKVNAAAKTTPQTTMETELHYATSASGTGMKQIFMVQEIPALTSPPEPQTYSSLESDEEFAAPGRKKYESIEITVLYVEEQHDELKALADAKTEVYFFVKLPDSTAVSDGKPLVYSFPGTLGLGNDTFSSDGMIQEKITIYKSGSVTELKGLPSSAS